LPGVDGEFDASEGDVWFGGAEFEASPELGTDGIDHDKGAEMRVKNA
jgi:hypothetical protein